MGDIIKANYVDSKSGHMDFENFSIRKKEVIIILQYYMNLAIK